MEAVKNGAPLKTTTRFFGMPLSMIGNHVNGRSQSTKRGPPPVLTQEEESMLEKYMIDMADYGSTSFKSSFINTRESNTIHGKFH